MMDYWCVLQSWGWYPWDCEASFGSLWQPLKACAREGLCNPIMAYPYIKLFDINLHGLFLLSCPAALKDGPDQAAASQLGCEVTRDRGNGAAEVGGLGHRRGQDWL